MRKRIVLSNDNALEVNDLKELDASSCVDELGVGNMLALNGGLVDRLRANEAFKPAQRWRFFRRPAMLIREKAISLGKMMVSTEKEAIASEDMKDNAESSVDSSTSDNALTITKKETAVKGIIDGARESGKSMMLFYAMCLAHSRGWIVVHLPDGSFFTIHKPDTFG